MMIKAARRALLATLKQAYVTGDSRGVRNSHCASARAAEHEATDCGEHRH